jgi:putative SOS response-associated peptidase YedK
LAPQYGQRSAFIVFIPPAKQNRLPKSLRFSPRRLVPSYQQAGLFKGQRAKQPYAIAMKDGASFGIAGIWENWKEPASGEWIRTFAIVTTDANSMVTTIHDRMPVVLAPSDYERWLDDELDPRDLMRPFPAGLMRMWPISTRVNKPENDDPSIIEPVELTNETA